MSHSRSILRTRALILVFVAFKVRSHRNLTIFLVMKQVVDEPWNRIRTRGLSYFQAQHFHGQRTH